MPKAPEAISQSIEISTSGGKSVIRMMILQIINLDQTNSERFVCSDLISIFIKYFQKDELDVTNIVCHFLGTKRMAQVNVFILFVCFFLR